MNIFIFAIYIYGIKPFADVCKTSTEDEKVEQQNVRERQGDKYIERDMNYDILRLLVVPNRWEGDWLV